MTYISNYIYISARIILQNRQTFRKTVRSPYIMLRLIYHTFLVLLLLLSTIGIRTSQHFCGSKLISTSFFSEADNCCPDKGTDNCCHNETKILRCDKDLYIANSSNLAISAVADIKINFIFEQKTNNTSTYKPAYSVNKHAPPSPRTMQLALLQSYII